MVQRVPTYHAWYTMPNEMIAWYGGAHVEMSILWAPMIIGLASGKIWEGIGCSYSKIMYRPHLSGIQWAIHSMHHAKNEHQQTVNKFGSCKTGSSNVIWLSLYIIIVWVSFLGIIISDKLPTSSCKWASKNWEQFFTFHRLVSMRNAAVIVFIWSIDHFYTPKHLWTVSCNIENQRSYCLNESGWQDQSGDRWWPLWRHRGVHLIIRHWRRWLGWWSGGSQWRSDVLGQVITHYKSSTAKGTEPCRYCHCTFSTSKLPKSSCGNGSTTAQTPKVIPAQQIIRIGPCTICPGTGASQQV